MSDVPIGGTPDAAAVAEEKAEPDGKPDKDGARSA